LPENDDGFGFAITKLGEHCIYILNHFLEAYLKFETKLALRVALWKNYRNHSLNCLANNKLSNIA